MNLSDDINDYCFFDFETRAKPGVSVEDGDVTTAGTYRYAASSYPVLLTHATGENPVLCEELIDFGQRMRWAAMPARLWDFYLRAQTGAAWFVAWNAAFDRETWNNAFPEAPLAVEMVIDAMAQAVASNLPPDLEGASTMLGQGGKQEDGKDLIRLFAPADGGTPQSHPVEWARYQTYGARDTDKLRDVFNSTLPLTRQEWREYWAGERINQRGMAVDLKFVERAAVLADADKKRTNRALKDLTEGVVTTVNQHQRIADWVWDRLEYSEARNIMTKELDEEDGELVITKIGIGRNRVEALLAFFADRKEKHGLTNIEEIVVRVLELRQFGGSATPLKFAKIMAQHDGGRLKGQYVFNGAQQTGRYSSRGVQVHNLTRSSLGEDEAEAIEIIKELEL